MAGADQITVHLREDRRHIRDRDVKLLKEILQIPLNLEIANTKEMIAFALSIRPHMVTLVPEKREEKTTEGGLNVENSFQAITQSVSLLQEQNIPVSLFIEPSKKDIDLTAKTGAKMIEIHTGRYAEFQDLNHPECIKEFQRIVEATQFAHENNLIVHAGHGLHYKNAQKISKIEHMCDLNIGHSIISYAVLVGLERAIREMKLLINF